MLLKLNRTALFDEISNRGFMSVKWALKLLQLLSSFPMILHVKMKKLKQFFFPFTLDNLDRKKYSSICFSWWRPCINLSMVGGLKSSFYRVAFPQEELRKNVFWVLKFLSRRNSIFSFLQQIQNGKIKSIYYSILFIFNK